MSQARVFNDQPYVPISMGSRAHKYLQLSNGILVLLISDPTEDLASCSLSVATGHHADPDGLYGLAHLCEHMVCVSSKEYPEIDLYKKLVFKAAGQYNAVTISEKTTYYFEVPVNNDVSVSNEPIFNYILKVFASCFKNPLFNEGYIKREIIAVDNEHINNCSALNRISYHGLRLLANPQHQFHRFSTGNFYTLNDIPNSKKLNIRDELVDFFQFEYTPNKMALVIRGPQSLNYLQKLVVSSFSDITSHSSGSRLFGGFKKKHDNTEIMKNSLSEFRVIYDTWNPRYNTLPFTRSELGKVILIENDTKAPVLRLVFPIIQSTKTQLSPVELSSYINWWCSIFGDESKSSVNATFFELRYIKETCTMTPEISSQVEVLELQLQLTPLGSRNIDSIFGILFDYIAAVFNENSVKHISKLLSQLNGIELYNFFHVNVSDYASAETRDLSRILLDDQSVISKWAVKGSPSFELNDENGYVGAYNESAEAKKWWLNQANKFILFVQNTIHPSNVVVSLIGPESYFKNCKCLSLDQPIQKDQYFGFSYKISNLSIYGSRKDSSFSLIKPNQFCPPDVDAQSQLFQKLNEVSKSTTLGYSVQNDSASTVPKLSFHDSGYQLWLKKENDMSFSDRAFLTLELTNIYIKPSPGTTLSIEIICHLVKNNLREILYPSLVLNYSYDLFPSIKGESGIIIHVSGPAANVYGVLKYIIDELKNITTNFRKIIKISDYRSSRVGLKLDYDGLKDEPSFTLASLGLLAVLEQYTFDLESRFEALEDLELEDTAKLADTLFDNCYLSGLLHGDVNSSSYKTDFFPIVQSLVQNFSSEGYVQASTIYLPSGRNYSIHRDSLDETNALTYFVQTGSRENVNNRTMTKFLAFVMSTTFSLKLRTQYQLGYAVFTGLRALKKTVGIHVTIMSGEHTPDDLDSKIDEILIEWYYEFIEELKKTDFKTEYVDRFVKGISSANQKLSQTGGVASLTAESIGTMSKTKIMKQHQGYWDQILNRSYRFSLDISGEDSINLPLIKNLEVDNFLKFIQTAILPTSKSRSKVSVMLTSKMSKEERESALKPIRIYAFLTAAGLPIKSDKLEEIIERSGDSQAALGRELFKYYKSQGSSLRLITAGLAKLSFNYFSSSKVQTKLADGNHIVAPNIEIKDLTEWQESIGFYKDRKSVNQILQDFK